MFAIELICPGRARRCPSRCDRRGLAHAVAAEQRHHFAVVDHQRHAEQHLAGAVEGFDALTFSMSAPSSPR